LLCQFTGGFLFQITDSYTFAGFLLNSSKSLTALQLHFLYHQKVFQHLMPINHNLYGRVRDNASLRCHSPALSTPKHPPAYITAFQQQGFLHLAQYCSPFSWTSPLSHLAVQQAERMPACRAWDNFLRASTDWCSSQYCLPSVALSQPLTVQNSFFLGMREMWNRYAIAQVHCRPYGSILLGERQR
jgi:hypothetical protein